MFFFIFLLQAMIDGPKNQLPVPKFEEQVIDGNISIGYGLALGDVDGDKKPDILLADKKQFVWYRNGDWKRFVMIENLTEFDNVCIAARDLDGDGKVEVAVGAQWNPGETTDSTQSGSVHYLVRPEDPTQLWKAMPLPHEPTVHRMRWAKSGDGSFYLLMLPLHGRGNKNGEGEPVKFISYKFKKDAGKDWNITVVDQSMHMTHNFDIVEDNASKKTDIYIGGKEGVRIIPAFKNNAGSKSQEITGVGHGAGEVRIGRSKNKDRFIAAIEPMHGTALVSYSLGQDKTRTVLDESFKEGHALAAADLLGLGYDQVVAGWRVPNADNKVGIKLYVPQNGNISKWDQFWIDDNGMATEDLQVMDLNGDGKPDIIASGRATKNLKVYWNRSEK